jgi:uncharacterized RDD family membrane protein YckC
MAEATYGGFWIRLLAYAADMSILTLVLLALAVPFTFMGGAGIALYSVIAALGPIAYFVWLTASDRQATFGKQLCGLKVQHLDSGAGISLLRSLGRELGKFVSAAVLFIGFLIVAFTGRKQGLHDMLASTVVARDGQPRIVLAILVALAGVLIPVIVIPLMFAGMFAGLMAMMMGGMMGGMMGEMEVKQSKQVPRMEQKVAPRPQAPAAPAAPQAATKVPAAEAPKRTAVEPAKPAPVEPAKPAAIETPKPAAPVAKLAPPEPAAPSRPAPSRREAAPAEPAEAILRQSKPPCVYKPVMTDEEIANCR